MNGRLQKYCENCKDTMYKVVDNAKSTKYYYECIDKTESIQLRVPKGKKEKYHAFAKSQGKSLNSLVQELLDSAINNFHKTS